MLYDDDADIVSKSREDLANMIILSVTIPRTEKKLLPSPNKVLTSLPLVVGAAGQGIQK